MLVHFLLPLRDWFIGFNLLRYITFRGGAAAVTALLLTFWIGPALIRLLTRLQIGEAIRATGPSTHATKRGTPTMGGTIILLAVLVPTLLFARLDQPYIQMVMLALLWMGLVGLLDDYLKVVRKLPDGLIGRYKLAGQIGLGLVIGGWLYFFPADTAIRSSVGVPFVANGSLDLGPLYIPLVILVIAGASNAVNFTDGLDGLATGLMGIAVLAFGLIAYVVGRVDFSDYLNIFYLPGAGELFIFAMAMLGACLGFLWFNAKPAEIFMGDTGSLSMGAALGCMAVILKQEFLLVIVGGMFVAEAASVILQMGYYKLTRRMTGEGRRLFRMAPLHHHFELRGWPESRVVIRFWILGILLALVSLTTFKII
ncbi:MAG: phospho-N-acetylmuramoyl-pentapeptide-transferase [Candidatus Marinimicrobia bacterium]|nr:phospho-N-acetylmuramoyl-pentapeptide-transferase [Candidatus Neomarinimicrobiota bacterium]